MQNVWKIFNLKNNATENKRKNPTVELIIFMAVDFLEAVESILKRFKSLSFHTNRNDSKEGGLCSNFLGIFSFSVRQSGSTTGWDMQTFCGGFIVKMKVR